MSFVLGVQTGVSDEVCLTTVWMQEPGREECRTEEPVLVSRRVYEGPVSSTELSLGQGPVIHDPSGPPR